ncbi:MAG: class I SAM-dependent methyltransferase [Catalinimonas sp.]
MPPLERTALRACRGRVLDVGAGAGPHALWLQARGLGVTALDTSGGAVAAMRQRGVRDVQHGSIEALGGDTYDTLLLLMNGAGLAGTLNALPRLLGHLRTLLRPGGQILLDSSDVRYLYVEEDGALSIDLNDRYHGEMVYQMHYGGESSSPFPWLFVDHDLLSDAALRAGLRTELVTEGAHYDYLSRLTVS